MRIVEFEELRSHETDNQYRNDRQQEAQADPEQSFCPENRFEEMRTRIDTQSGQINYDPQLAKHQVGAHRRVGGQMETRTECPHQNPDDDRSSGDTQFDRRAHPRQRDRQCPQQHPQRDADKDRQQVRIVKPLDLVP